MSKCSLLLFVLCANVALAADWWTQPYGAATLMSDRSPAESMTITGQAGGGRTSLMPNIDTASGGGIIVSMIPESGRGTFGFEVEFVSGSKSGEAYLADAELGAPTVKSSVSGLAIGGFFSGVVPWISGESFSGSLGGGLGMFRASRDTDLAFRERHTDPDTEEISIVDVSESASNSSTSIYLSVFLTEEFRVRDGYRLAATAGFRGITSTKTTVTTESLTGEFEPEFTGPFVRLGLKIDI